MTMATLTAAVQTNQKIQGILYTASNIWGLTVTTYERVSLIHDPLQEILGQSNQTNAHDVKAAI